MPVKTKEQILQSELITLLEKWAVKNCLVINGHTAHGGGIVAYPARIRKESGVQCALFVDIPE